MQSIETKFVLVRVNIRTNEKTVIVQSENRQELQQLKGMLESQVPMDIFIAFKYSIEEMQEELQ